MIPRYDGWPGTGLRLEDPKDDYRFLDTGGTHGQVGGMTMCVGERHGVSATIELNPEDVARVASVCNDWLAWHLGGRVD